jgi:hypothetical protein
MFVCPGLWWAQIFDLRLFVRSFRSDPTRKLVL